MNYARDLINNIFSTPVNSPDFDHMAHQLAVLLDDYANRIDVLEGERIKEEQPESQPQPPDPILPEVGRTNNLPASADAPNSIELAEQRSVYLFATIYYGGCVERLTKSQANSLAAFIKHGNEILGLLNYLVEKHHHTPQGEKALRILRDVEKGEWE